MTREAQGHFSMSKTNQIASDRTDHYEHPDQVLQSQLDPDGKRRLLEEWHLQEQALLIATDDGMPAPGPTWLKEVTVALLQLEGRATQPRRSNR